MLPSVQAEGAVAIVWIDDSNDAHTALKANLDSYAHDVGRTIYVINEDTRQRVKKYGSSCADATPQWPLWCATVNTMAEDGKTMIAALSTHAKIEGYHDAQKLPNNFKMLKAFLNKAYSHKSIDDLLKKISHDEL